MVVGLYNHLSQTSNANDSIDMEMAPSLIEADEILAKFGYVEEEALQMAA
tara:strand:- start:57 stop:206 length:150 start_codon:yes stop_codon:yes gene_type:complete